MARGPLEQRDPARIDWRELEVCPPLHTKEGTSRRASALIRDPASQRSRRRPRFP